MGKINLDNSFINRLNTTDIPAITFYFNFATVDAIVGGGTLTVKTSTTPDFATSATVTPASFEIETATVGTYSTVSGNTVAAANLAKHIRLKLTALGTDKIQYAKVIYTEGGVSFESVPILFSTWKIINFTLTTAIDFGAVRPKKVGVKDVKTSSGAAYTIKVEACNNAFDTTPTWEDITASYLTGDFFTFTNRTKTGTKWGINIRYTITKTNAADVVELTEFYVYYV